MIILILVVIIVLVAPEILASRVSKIMYINYDVKEPKKKITKKEALEDLESSDEEQEDSFEPKDVDKDAEELLSKINGKV